MEKTLRIKQNGHAPNTVGWLAEHAATIKLGETKYGLRGAWLADEKGETIQWLLTEATEAERGDGSPQWQKPGEGWSGWHEWNRAWTAAARKTLISLAEMAAAEYEAQDSAEAPIRYRLEKA